jgi:small-conductance mechanosensitive channel
MIANGFLDSLARSLAALLSGGMQAMFGSGVQARVLGPLTWADLGVVLCFLLVWLLIHTVAAAVLRRKIGQAMERPAPKLWRSRILAAVGWPLYLLIWVCGSYVAVTPVLLKLPPGEAAEAVRELASKVFALGVFAALFWLCFRFTRELEAWLAVLAGKTRSKLDDLVVPLVGRSLRVIVPVAGIIFALPVLELSPGYAAVLARGSSILLIGTLAWIFSQAVHLGERAVLTRYDISVADNLQARKVYTQVHILSRTLYVVIALFTVASILMLFEEVRRFGTSILASAGVVGIVVGFAAQRTIANLVAGFQLAMTQPIRLDDVVIVEGEWGRIEEITLTYVVVRLWDDRRLIVPLSYFIEKPFQNWTRVSADILGSVFVWADYSLPIAQLRPTVQRIVEGCKDWDRRFWNLQITDTTERAMQLRVLATAADASKAWDLRCEIREKLLAFIQQNYPQSLPKLRADLVPAPPGNPKLPQPAKA